MRLRGRPSASDGLVAGSAACREAHSRTKTPSAEPSAAEPTSLDAIRVVAEVRRVERLPPKDRSTPDLRLGLADGRTVCVKVTLAIDEEAEGLNRGARKMRRYRAEERDVCVFLSSSVQSAHSSAERGVECANRRILERVLTKVPGQRVKQAATGSPVESRAHSLTRADC